MKRILLFIDNLGAGGAQRQLVGLAILLKNFGYEVKVLTYQNFPFYLPELEKNNVDYEWLSKAENKYVRIYYIYKFVKKYRPDYLISYLETPSIISSLIKLFYNKFSLIVSERNTTQKNGLREWMRFNLFRVAHKIVPNSYSQEVFIKKHYSFLSSKVVTITNFVDTEIFCPQYHELRDVPEIVVAASIWESKNTLNFIEALDLLRKKQLKFHVSWYGKSLSNINFFDRCQNKIKELGLEEYICLLDKTNKIIEKYNSADFLCLPSLYEGTPNVICEAISCGLPIICSDVCDNHIYVKESVNGFLFNPFSIESISNAIEKMITIDNETYLCYCQQSRMIAKSKLSKEVFVKKYIALITNVGKDV